MLVYFKAMLKKHNGVSIFDKSQKLEIKIF